MQQIRPLVLSDVLAGRSKLLSFLSEDVRPDLVSQVVRWQMAARRLGVRATKGISMIRGTTRKPHRQKGTGRARQGSLRSPQFRGGAVIFGPVKRSHAFSMNKKERVKAMRGVLSQHLGNGSMLLVEGNWSEDVVKSKVFAQNVGGIVDDWATHKILFVGDFGREFLLSSRAFINIDVISMVGLNVYDILLHDLVVFHVGSLDALEERLAK